jgi:hypothetical protein
VTCAQVLIELLLLEADVQVVIFALQVLQGKWTICCPTKHVWYC